MSCRWWVCYNCQHARLSWNLKTLISVKVLLCAEQFQFGCTLHTPGSKQFGCRWPLHLFSPHRSSNIKISLCAHCLCAGWKAIIRTRMEAGFAPGGDLVRRRKPIPKPSRGTTSPHSQDGDMQFIFIYYNYPSFENLMNLSTNLV